MTEYWVISVPGDPTPNDAFQKLHHACQNQGAPLSANYRFNLPDLKVGTLDVLVGLSDDLGKLDMFVDGVTKKIAHYLYDVLEADDLNDLQQNLTVSNMTLSTYVSQFSWDVAKYPIRQALRSISDQISKKVTQIETDLKSKSTTYNTLRGTLQSLERRQTGSLLTRNLYDLVKRENFVIGSEYLVTLVVCVPKANQADWWNKYEKLTDMVVPRSSIHLFEDNEYALFTVTLFRRVADEYKLHCRENRFIVRDFEYSDEASTQSRTEIDKLSAAKKKQYGPLVRWLKVNFGESFAAWIHVKAMRVFVESVLRYGLPVNFQAVILQPQRKSQKKLREVLKRLYQHLDSSTSVSDAAIDIPGLAGFAQSDFFPYVYYDLNVEMFEGMKMAGGKGR